MASPGSTTESDSTFPVDALEALDAATRAIAGVLDLDAVLQLIVERVCTLADARYAALGIVDEFGGIDRFITVGITPEQRALLGPPPTGHGLLGLIIREGRSYRIPDIAAHPDSYGFPPNHPPMTSLLGVPVTVKGRAIGNLYLTDKRGAGAFSAADQQLVELFAHHAGIAIENARLHEQVRQLAVVEERDRIGQELHDGIIQSLYAVTLSLEDVETLMTEDPAEAKARVDRAIDAVQASISDIRNFVLGLRPHLLERSDLVGGLAALADELRLNTMVDVEVDLDEGVAAAAALSDGRRAQLAADCPRGIEQRRASRRGVAGEGRARARGRHAAAPDCGGQRPRVRSGHGTRRGAPGTGEHARSRDAHGRPARGRQRTRPRRPYHRSRPPLERRIWHVTNDARPVMRLLVVDDHEVVRQGLVALLDRREGFQVVAEAGTAAEAVEQARKFQPELVVMDVRLPDGSGIEACREIRAEYPNTRVVMLTSYPDEEAVLSAIVAGASGYLLKQIRARDLVAALEAVGRGESLLDPAVTEKVLERIRRIASGTYADEVAQLTPQEQKILLLVAEGKTNKEIAADVFLSDKTVKNYVSSILSKLNLERRAQAAAFVAKHRIDTGH